jgi:predicted double-glycine peptidase
MMIFAYRGDLIAEATLVKRLGTTKFGTPLSNAQRLQTRHTNVHVTSLTVEQLQQHLRQGIPVIVRVWTEMLTYWDRDTSHVAVVVGFDEESVYLNDPAFSTGPQSIVWDSFLAAWAEFDERSVIIT